MPPLKLGGGAPFVELAIVALVYRTSARASGGLLAQRTHVATRSAHRFTAYVILQRGRTAGAAARVVAWGGVSGGGSYLFFFLKLRPGALVLTMQPRLLPQKFLMLPLSPRSNSIGDNRRAALHPRGGAGSTAGPPGSRPRARGRTGHGVRSSGGCSCGRGRRRMVARACVAYTMVRRCGRHGRGSAVAAKVLPCVVPKKRILIRPLVLPPLTALAAARHGSHLARFIKLVADGSRVVFD